MRPGRVGLKEIGSGRFCGDFAKFGVACLEELGVVGANIKRIVRGLTVYITAILIGAPLAAVMGCSPEGSGADFAVNIGLIISFVIAARTPGYMEGMALYYIFKKK